MVRQRIPLHVECKGGKLVVTKAVDKRKAEACKIACLRLVL